MQKPGLRPTSNRVRETLFNWLQAYVEGSQCLDLFAGSGALGFEAASRGASLVTMTEKDATISRMLSEQAELLQADNIDVQHADGRDYLKTSVGQFDIIFLDPPFNEIDLLPLISTLAETAIIKITTKIYVECPAGQLPDVLPKHWHWWRRAKAGQVEYGLIATD